MEIIGEAARYLSDEIRNEMSEIPWKKVVGLRNILIHAYEGIDPDEIWGVIVEEIPKFKQIVTHFMQEHNLEIPS